MEQINQDAESEEKKQAEEFSITPIETTSTGIKSLDWMKEKWSKFQSYTKRQASDSLWVLGIKLFFQAIGVLILIILSPFALLGILIAFMVAT